MKENQKKKKPEELLVEYLNCPCQIFQPMKDDSVLMEAYTEAVERGKKEGFVPVLVCCESPETMLETFIWNTSEKNSDETDDSFDIEAVRAFREEMCKKELPEGKAVLKEFRKQYDDEEDEYDEDDEDDEDWEDDEEYDEDDEDDEDDDEYDEDDDEYDEDDEEYDEDDEYGDEYEDWEKECLRQMAEEEDEYDDEDDSTFSAYISYDGVNATTTVVLAEIPVTHPWEIFAWLPFGGWNECPCTEDLMAVSKYWYEAYGAVPATISHDVLEYMVPEPVKKKDSRELAEEMGIFCSDIILQGVGDVRILANMLTESTVWYFWWD